jgi:chromosome segregation ATPase
MRIEIYLEDYKMQNQDSYLEEFRESVTSSNKLKKRLGSYNSKEVDHYIKDLQEHQQNLENIYQTRFEEQRLSLLGLTRERDELIKKTAELEAQLTKANNWQQNLSEQGLTAVDKEELERLQKIAELDTSLTEQNGQLKQENADLKEELSSVLQENKDYEDLQNLSVYQTEQISKLQAEFQSVTALFNQEKSAKEHLLSEIEELKADRKAQMKSRENQIRSAIEKYQSAMENYSVNLKQMVESYDGYLESMKMYGRSVLQKYDQINSI